MPLPYKNPSGFKRANNEEELYTFLKNEYFPKRFGKPLEEQFEFARNRRIDFFLKEPTPTLIEVKNWFVTIKDMGQIMEYLAHATYRYKSDGFHFMLICGGIDQEKRSLLEPLGVEIILTKDIFT